MSRDGTRRKGEGGRPLIAGVSQVAAARGSLFISMQPRAAAQYCSAAPVTQREYMRGGSDVMRGSVTPSRGSDGH